MYPNDPLITNESPLILTNSNPLSAHPYKGLKLLKNKALRPSIKNDNPLQRYRLSRTL
jgi:hypothetical protein